MQGAGRVQISRKKRGLPGANPGLPGFGRRVLSTGLSPGLFRLGAAGVQTVKCGKPVDRLAIGSGNQVTVNVNRQFDARMPELVLDVSQGLPVLYQQAGKGMPKVMKSDLTQLCLGQSGFETTILEVVHIRRVSFVIREDPNRNLV